ncbi:MAG: PorT family protein [Tannerella sp.]|jgi:hypothetical protein|nr:PorT family protein [Tannerella sp.]
MKYINILFFFLSFPCFSQLYIGANGGLAISDLNGVYRTVKKNEHVGYKVGFSLQYMLSKFGIESGLYIAEKGISNSEGILEVDQKFYRTSLEISPLYMELPVSLVYNIPIERKVNLQINLGGYFAYGFQGKGLISVEDFGSKYGILAFEDIEIINHQEIGEFTAKGANRFDFGLTSGVGLIVHNIKIKANYDFGLCNVFDVYPIQADNRNKVKNRTFWIELGYNLKLSN